MEYSDTVPIQYEIGQTVFMGKSVRVDPRVFIPRPETELLVRIAADLCHGMSLSRPRLLDVGTGSGAIAIGLAEALVGCRVIGLDISHEALEVAGENVRDHSLSDRISFKISSMFEGLGDEYEGFFDAVVSNPPYVAREDYEAADAWVKAEPRIALDGGLDGMDHLRILAEKSGRFIKPGGFIAVEVGYDQGLRVKDLFGACGFTGIKGFRDFNNYERVIVGWKKQGDGRNGWIN